MRLDRYLKLSRLIKRRTLAKEITDQGRVLINGNVAKAGRRVNVGDELTIFFGQTVLTVKVLNIKEHVRKNEATDLYEIIEEKRIEEDD